MTHKILIAVNFTFLLLGVACNWPCSGKKVPLGLIYANPNDSLKIILRDKIEIDKIILSNYDGRFRDRRDRLATWCITEDSILVKVKFNERDTSFYLYPKQIKGWYVGRDMKGYIHIYYDYERGGLREYDTYR